MFLIFIGIVLLISGYYIVIVVKARTETPAIIKKALNKENITLKVENLSQWQLNALLAVEDPNFYKHQGVDLKTPGAGITTITQALVKIYYFDKFKPGFFAKLKQTLIARFALDPLVSKNDQLKLFINNVYLGKARDKQVYGLENAAELYYHKKFRRLTENEYLSIVAMIIAPNNFNILTKPAANAERTKRIKKVVSGEYKPKHLMDIYYGLLDKETQKGLAPVSYLPSIY
ncbi:MAG TPA: glycosyl transferase family 51 [Elusimicrobia bacterium]|nr:glycosyl transferase family 51 [Elusimicrobiota bacterium]